MYTKRASDLRYLAMKRFCLEDQDRFKPASTDKKPYAFFLNYYWSSSSWYNKWEKLSFYVINYIRICLCLLSVATSRMHVSTQYDHLSPYERGREIDLKESKDQINNDLIIQDFYCSYYLLPVHSHKLVSVEPGSIDSESY